MNEMTTLELVGLFPNTPAAHHIVLALSSGATLDAAEQAADYYVRMADIAEATAIKEHTR